MRLANGREASALDIQEEYFTKASDFADAKGLRTGTIAQVLELWGRTLEAIRAQDFAKVEREIDWVMKYQLIERYREKHGMNMSHPVARSTWRTTTSTKRGLFYLLQNRGQAERTTNDLKIFEAKSIPPQTTRARLRGDFIRRAQEQRRDFTVDWCTRRPERPGAAHGPLQGPVPLGRRAGGEADRGDVGRAR